MFTFPREFIPYVNMILAIWVLIALYRGYKRGFLLQLVDFIGTIVALFGAWLLSEPLARVFRFIPNKGNGYASVEQMINFQVNRLIWIVILFIAIRIILLAVRPLASFISKMPLIKQVNSWIGGVVSIVIYFFQLLVLIYFLSFPFVKNGMEIVSGTVLRQVKEASMPLFSFVEEGINRNSALQSILNDKELSAAQSDAIVQWLTDQGFTSNDIKEFLGQNE